MRVWARQRFATAYLLKKDVALQRLYRRTVENLFLKNYSKDNSESCPSLPDFAEIASNAALGLPLLRITQRDFLKAHAVALLGVADV